MRKKYRKSPINSLRLHCAFTVMCFLFVLACGLKSRKKREKANSVFCVDEKKFINNGNGYVQCIYALTARADLIS